MHFAVLQLKSVQILRLNVSTTRDWRECLALVIIETLILVPARERHPGEAYRAHVATFPSSTCDLDKFTVHFYGIYDLANGNVLFSSDHRS